MVHLPRLDIQQPKFVAGSLIYERQWQISLARMANMLLITQFTQKVFAHFDLILLSECSGTKSLFANAHKIVNQSLLKRAICKLNLDISTNFS